MAQRERINFKNKIQMIIDQCICIHFGRSTNNQPIGPMGQILAVCGSWSCSSVGTGGSDDGGSDDGGGGGSGRPSFSWPHRQQTKTLEKSGASRYSQCACHIDVWVLTCAFSLWCILLRCVAVNCDGLRRYAPLWPIGRLFIFDVVPVAPHILVSARVPTILHGTRQWLCVSVQIDVLTFIANRAHWERQSKCFFTHVLQLCMQASLSVLCAVYLLYRPALAYLYIVLYIVYMHYHSS